MRMESINLSRSAASILTALGRTHPERTVSWLVEDGLQTVGDEDLMNIALSYLLRDAWNRLGGSDHSMIEVGASIVDNRTVFQIRDNGAGFESPLCTAEPTDPFERLRTASEFGETEIGLAIVERVIRRHRGRIWVESPAGGGVVFCFTIGTESQCRGAGAPGNRGGAVVVGGSAGW